MQIDKLLKTMDSSMSISLSTMEPEVICVMSDECVEGRVGEEDCAIDKETFDSPVGLAR